MLDPSALTTQATYMWPGGGSSSPFSATSVMPERWTMSLGQSAEKLAGIYGIGRQQQDEFALRSHQRAVAAWENGFYEQWVVPVPGTELEREHSRQHDHFSIHPLIFPNRRRMYMCKLTFCVQVL